MPIRNKHNRLISAHEKEYLYRTVFKTELKTIVKLIIWAVIDAYNSKTGQCNPSASHIAIKINKSPSTVLKNLKEAQNSGFIKRTMRGNVGKSNTYTINFDLLAGLRKDKSRENSSAKNGTQPIPNEEPTYSENGTQPIPNEEQTYSDLGIEPIPKEQHEHSKEHRKDSMNEHKNITYENKEEYIDSDKFYEDFGHILN